MRGSAIVADPTRSACSAAEARERHGPAERDGIVRRSPAGAGARRTRRELRGVQWRQKTVRTALANEAGKILYAAETTVTIPALAAPGGLTLAPGDVLVFGACAAEISEEYTEDDLIRGHGAVIVQSVADNTLRPRLRSWKVVCV